MQYRELSASEWPWPLLLEADPSREQIERYIHDSTVLGMFNEQTVIGVIVLQAQSPQVFEVMNLAVEPDYRGQGIGKALMVAAIARAQAEGGRRLIVATGNSSLDPLAFYQKLGFSLEACEPDYFVRTYPTPIFENGLQCRDRLWLGLSLESDGKRPL
ncbi:GNAT family N-acetyltransferase [Synechococcus elongatus]|uniref:Acetyltransferase n=2 Tax=Synechococcus elongatus TaxID=32046 RepID=Q8GMS6_SYNE7|nr:GNAT family N-acetyltransferase [Synechococcus elongatus]ABB56492.1 putative acetyltransferase [Synechococcus elongatus PCC 7942 = FACHB-805]AJD56464.1 GCN5 family acetyltransferase [Synechococcus elongatus UTEX 2973]MBD2588926.1 GNAT family N-acetyltransferase [Synechococcus elongatus FACHB-242]MBD2689992.1 GNAT family N-acetyltransferase [Synechococcus elongatus FACHB-1061]MBD2706963.1 GNAT family N-acetyltransferase [Synechococcus elongatus PCC 7942 = FACHB-805]